MTINAQRENEVSPKYRWWDDNDKGVAAGLAAVAANIERWNYQRRFLNLTCLRYMTGREMTSQFAYSMARRPTQLARAYAAASWKAPSFNLIATCADVYASRIWKSRPFVQVIPIAGNFKARIRSKKLSRFVDAVFADTNLWDIAEDCGMDAVTVGNTFVKCQPAPDGSKRIDLSRAFGDEILINEEEASLSRPRSMIQRVFEHKEIAAIRADTPEKRAAIQNAPSVFAGLYFGTGELNTNDVVPLLEGWHLPHPSGGNSKKDAGRHVLAAGHVQLFDEPWERPRFPIAKMNFSRHPTVGYFRQGMAEQLLGIQQEIDRADAAIWESARRQGWPRWLLDRASGVEPGDLAGKAAGLIYYTGGGANPPQPITPAVMSADYYAKRNQWVAEGFRRARINPETAAGEHPEGLSSGAAIMAAATIDDAAHADVGQRFEDFITDIANLVFDEAEVVKPKVRLPGRYVDEIDWNEVAMSRNNYSARAFPMSRLPQLPAARLQTIQNWYDQGIIDKATKLRLEQVPDTAGFMDLANASRDNIEMLLDEIIEQGGPGYRPPEPYIDLPLALATAQSRLLQEQNEKTPDDRLRLLQQWIFQTQDMIEQSPPKPVGIQPPQGMPSVPQSQAPPAGGPEMAAAA